MDKPLRILAIVNLPWDPRLGAARVFMELTEQWKTAGHYVEHFCLTDAFTKPVKSRWLSTLRQLLFPARAAGFVRRNAARFDVVDAAIGTLPFSKEDLRFDGLLVARSVGFYRSFERFIRVGRKRWPDQPRGKFLGHFFYRSSRWWQARNSEISVRHCDLVNLPNDDELELLPKAKSAIVEPYGLSEGDRTAFASAASSAETRLARKEICFVGMWSLRKGSRDWPQIIERIRKIIPDAQFMLLGTMTNEQAVFKDLRLSAEDGVRCVSTYDPEQLPSLLTSCTVGLFPSYIEGFGLAVLEQLACGIPTVAYDVPGPRQILQQCRASLLVNEGDAAAMANRAVDILKMSVGDYGALSAQCLSIADQFRWKQIATDTAREYVEALRELPHRR
ncbi:MAG: glycosyltransferase [Verrucomicrobiota bacterium]